MLSDAATLDVVSGADVSELEKEVPEQLQNFGRAEKSAVMVELQRNQQSVVAGSDLCKTEEALTQKIGQIQDAPDVQTYVNQTVRIQKRALVASDPSLKKGVKGQLQNVVSCRVLRNDLNCSDKSAKKTNNVHNTALAVLSAQPQIQQDLLGPEASLPSAAQVVGNQPDVQGKLRQSYPSNFSGGGSLMQLLGQKEAHAGQSLNTSNVPKAAYDAALPQSLPPGSASQLFGCHRRPVAAIDKRSRADGNIGDGARRPGSVSDAVAPKNKAQQVKDAYDNTKHGLSSAKDGVDAARELVGREASAGLSRMAGSIGGTLPEPWWWKRRSWRRVQPLRSGRSSGLEIDAVMSMVSISPRLSRLCEAHRAKVF